MIKVLFVCHGNICRSPMAEFVFKDLVEKQGLSSMFHIESRATSSEEIGNGIHYGTRRKLDEHGIKGYESKRDELSKEDINNLFDNEDVGLFTDLEDYCEQAKEIYELDKFISGWNTLGYIYNREKKRIRKR